MAANYRIGQFASLTGVPAKTLRYYDELGILRPAAVDPRTQYRLYAPHQLHDLASILVLKELGVCLKDIRQFIKRGGSKENRRALLRQVRNTVAYSIEAATRSLRSIDTALSELEDSAMPIP